MSSVRRVVSVVDRTQGNICSTFSSSLGSTLLLIERGYNYHVYLRVITLIDNSTASKRKGKLLAPVDISILAIFTLFFLYLNSPYFLFMYSLLSCKPIQQHLQSPSSFILVLGKANVKRA